MDFDGLKAFIAVTDAKSFSIAADQLHLTQPAVSKRISLLESQLGCRVFDRIGRTITLTEAGRQLYPSALKILAEVEDTRRRIVGLEGDISGQLSVATSHHVGLWRLPDPLKDYSLRYPSVNLDLHFMDSEVAHTQIVQGNLELGIITLAPTHHERLTTIPIWHDELVFVCAREHPLVDSGVGNAIELEQLSAFPAVLPDMSTFTGRIVKRLFDEQGLPLTTGMSTNYLETIKMLISVGLGWSVLPRTMVDADIRQLAIPDVSISRTLGVIHHNQRTLSNAGAAFIEMLVDNSNV